MGQDELENTIAQSLMAIGLYTISFEATALSFRAKVHEYLTETDRSQLSRFKKACGTAYNTFDFCGPILLANSVIGQADLESLTAMRERRNLFAHQGHNRVFDLEVQEVLPDVKQLHKITQKVQGWRIPVRELRLAPRTVEFSISPAFFGFVAQIVEQMSYGRIDVRLKRNKD